MKEIKLTQGLVAIIDDEDYQLINQFKWYGKKTGNIFYAERAITTYSIDRKINQVKILMHRLIMKTPYEMEIDHINHNGLDNRKENLRIVTRRENALNMTKCNMYGYRGIHKRGNTYQAFIHLNGIKKALGSYKTPLEAYNAYVNAFNELDSKSLYIKQP